jgi:hypothetical protein
MNLVAYDPRSGKVLKNQSFDTYASKPASDKLYKTLVDLPAKTIIALGVKDEGSRSLKKNLKDWLINEIGAKQINSLGFR